MLSICSSKFSFESILMSNNFSQLLSFRKPSLIFKKSFSTRDQMVLSSMCFPANIYLFKVNYKNTTTRCEICSKLTIKNTRTTSLTIVYFEQVNVSWILIGYPRSNGEIFLHIFGVTW